MRTLITLIVAVSLLASCDHRENLADAYGNFEVEDVIVSAEANGKLLKFSLKEGDQLKKDQMVGIIDTLAIKIQLAQLDAQQLAVQSKIENVKAQMEAQKQQIENVKVQYERVAKLFETGAATEQQRDELEGQLKLAEKQLKASRSQINSIYKEIDVLEQQKNLMRVQLDNCFVKSPLTGVVLEKYRQRGELVGAGKPLFKIANLNTVTLRCYISGDQLTSVKLGDKLKVSVDGAGGTMKDYEGTVSWIADKAEFTPKIIQTKEERTKLVYAMKVRVKNDGDLKIGMPGELRF